MNITSAGGLTNTYPYTITMSNVTPITVNPNDWAVATTTPSTLEVSGSANIHGELTVQGIKLSDRLDKIESRLAILHPNENLEERWEELRQLREAYVALERDIIEKEKIWEILKK